MVLTLWHIMNYMGFQRPFTFRCRAIDDRKLEQFFQWNTLVGGATNLPIHLAFDHDIEGMRYDLMVVRSWINRRSDRVFMELDWKRPNMQIKLNYHSGSLAEMERDADFINKQIASGPEGIALTEYNSFHKQQEAIGRR